MVRLVGSTLGEVASSVRYYSKELAISFVPGSTRFMKRDSQEDRNRRYWLSEMWVKSFLEVEKGILAGIAAYELVGKYIERVS